MLIVGLLGALGLASCTSDGATSPPPSPPTSSAPDTSDVATTSSAPPTSTAPKSPTIATTGPNVRPGEKPPKEPALARNNSRQGAAEFAYYWVQALDWGYATTDSALPKSLYLPQCRTCAELVATFDRERAKGRHFVGGRLLLEQRRIVSNDHRHAGSTVVDVYFDQSGVKTADRSGKVVEKDLGTDFYRYRTWLSWLRDHWAVLDFKRAV